MYDLSDCAATIDTIFNRFNAVFPHCRYPLEEVACLLLQLMAFLPPQTENHRVVDDSTSARVMQ